MRVVRILGMLILGFGLLVISACAKNGGVTGMMATEKTQTYTAGLGERTRFTAADMATTYTTKAPSDQIYYFDFDDNTVDRKYLASVRAQARYLAANSGAKILLAGHADERGSREYNVALGERRAQGVANLLRLNGVDNRQIRVISYGKERLVDRTGDLSDADFHALNRRVVLTYEAIR